MGAIVAMAECEIPGFSNFGVDKGTLMNEVFDPYNPWTPARR